jgi:hypothetical protein
VIIFNRFNCRLLSFSKKAAGIKPGFSTSNCSFIALCAGRFDLTGYDGPILYSKYKGRWVYFISSAGDDPGLNLIRRAAIRNKKHKFGLLKPGRKEDFTMTATLMAMDTSHGI